MILAGDHLGPRVWVVGNDGKRVRRSRFGLESGSRVEHRDALIRTDQASLEHHRQRGQRSARLEAEVACSLPGRVGLHALDLGFGDRDGAPARMADTFEYQVVAEGGRHPNARGTRRGSRPRISELRTFLEGTNN